MIHSKVNPIGLDLALYRIQQKLDAIGWENTDVYGRLYINEKGKQKLAETHIGNGQYKEVFVDDKKNAVFGFIVGDTRQHLSLIKCSVTLICSCRLNKLYDSTELKDEETLQTVVNVIKQIVMLPNQGDIKTGLKSVFADISYEKFKFRDMYPWFNFSISFDLNYKL